MHPKISKESIARGKALKSAIKKLVRPITGSKIGKAVRKTFSR